MRALLIVAGYCGIAAAAGHAQPLLLSPRASLEGLLKQKTLPACADSDQLRASKDRDAEYLHGIFGSTGWENVGREYTESLNDLLDGLLKAVNNPDIEQACASIRLIVRDLHTKKEDCSAVGHSRTGVPVRIAVLRGDEVLKGWVVYTRWIPAGDRFTTVAKPLPWPSSPALGSVPIPGEFEIFAKDPSSGVLTEPARVSIGRPSFAPPDRFDKNPVFDWELEVPLVKSKISKE